MKLLVNLVFLFTLLSSILIEVSAESPTKLPLEQSPIPQFQIVKVLEVSPLESASGGLDELISAKEQQVKVKVISDGPQKNTELFINNIVPDNLAFGIVAKKDKEYIISLADDSNDVAIIDYHRKPYVIGLFILFVVLIIGFSGFKGFKAILSLFVTALSIIYILIPAIKEGYDPILVGIFISAIATAVTVISIAGFTKKAFAATIGSIGAVAIAGLTSFFVIKGAPLSGLASNEAQILLANSMYGSTTSMMNFQGILSAGVIIASLGAAMDVAVSIASATQELYLTDIHQSFNNLFKHAMNVGKDIMGTMTDTLILAYTGASLPLFLLLESYEPKALLLNMEIIVTELTSALAGSIGIIFAIPLTAIISVFMYKWFKR
jgi:uncharacterized membrane protein